MCPPGSRRPKSGGRSRPRVCQGVSMTYSDGIEITGSRRDRYDEVLTPAALDLVAALHRELAPRRAALLSARNDRQQEIIDGGALDFLAKTAEIRADHSWRVAPPAPGL